MKESLIFFLFFAFGLLPWVDKIIQAEGSDDLSKKEVMAQLATVSSEDYVPNELLIKFRSYILEGDDYDDVSDVLTQAGITFENKQRLSDQSYEDSPEIFNIYHVVMKEGSDVKQAVTNLNNHTDVWYAEPNYRVYADFIPNDASFSRLWGLHNTGQSGGVADADIDAPEAWDIHQGDASSVVGVVDTGVNSSHPDLRNKVVNNSTDCGIFHGTHVGGTIGAETNNSLGVAGVGFKVSLAGYNGLACNGSGDFAKVAQEIINATNAGVKVINLSLGGPQDSSAARNAVNDAVSKGVLVVAAAGNCGEGCPSSNCSSANQISYPAAYSNTMAVAATDRRDRRACFSNKNNYVDVAAPGVAVYSTVGSSYGEMQGTSMAAPHVSGLAGLLYSLPRFATRNTTNAQAIRQIIETTTDDLGPVGKDSEYGTGRINAYQALLSASGGTPPPSPTPTLVLSPTPTPSGVLTPTITPSGVLTPTPPRCSGADLNGDGRVNQLDLDTLLNNYSRVGPPTPVGDLNRDSKVNGIDAVVLITCWQ